MACLPFERVMTISEKNVFVHSSKAFGSSGNKIEIELSYELNDGTGANCSCQCSI